MQSQWIITLSPVIALMANVLTQIITVHWFRRATLSIIIGLTTGLTLTLIFCCFLSNIDSVATCLLTYLALSFCYWAFLNLNITSLRIRIARELLIEQKNGLSTDDLLLRYSPQELINRRIKRLETTGHIMYQGEKWTLRSKKYMIFIIVSSCLRKIIIPSYFTPN